MSKRGRLPRKGRSRGSRKGRAKRGSGIRPPRVHFGFTDLKVTGFGGAPLLADAAKAHGLPDLLGKAVSVKSCGRGATDAETMWAIVAHEAKGFAPLFLDGTGIEVDGRLFERAQVNHDGERGYWLHAAFIGGSWAASR